MLWVGHLSLGYLFYKIILSVYPAEIISQYELNILLVVTLIASILPDLDFISFFTKNKSMKLQNYSSHRTQISHAPLIYLTVGVIFYLVSQTIFFKIASILFIVGIMGHFIGDSIEYGIMWLWPLSKKQYSLHKVPKENIQSSGIVDYYWKFFWSIYVKNWTFWIELGVILTAIFIIF